MIVNEQNSKIYDLKQSNMQLQAELDALKARNCRTADSGSISAFEEKKDVGTNVGTERNGNDSEVFD